MPSYHGATELRPIEASLESLPDAETYASVLLARLRRVAEVPSSAADILDIGAAQGLFLVGCARLGHHAVGVEPWSEARETATRIAQHAGVSIEIADGIAEKLTFSDASFDVVCASSVIEHVDDAAATFKEVFRVLKPGGVFWFQTASCLCPRQGEIRGFPAFSWYPDALKLKIMEWAKNHRPGLIGYTQHPAIHWFTPKKARRMLHEAGFVKIYDRWDLRLPSEGGGLYRTVLTVIKLGALTKLVADVAVPTCSYAALKATSA